MTQRFSADEAARILKNANFVDQAAIAQGNADSPKYTRKITLKLDEARGQGNALKLGFPFQACYVASATDVSTTIGVNPFVADDNVVDDAAPLKLNDALNFEYPVSNAFFTWDAQAGKEITLLFILKGSFRSGSTLTEVSSSVDGNSFSDHTATTHTNAGFTAVLAQDLTRKIANLVFSADVYLGSSTSSTNTYRVIAGAPVKISNTGALYAKAVGADAVSSGLIES